MMMITSAAGRRLAKAGHALKEQRKKHGHERYARRKSGALPADFSAAISEFEEASMKASEELIDQNMHEQLGD